MSRDSSALTGHYFLPHPLSPVSGMGDPSFRLVMASSQDLDSEFFTSSASDLDSGRRSTNTRFMGTSDSRMGTFLHESFVSFGKYYGVFPSFRSDSLNVMDT